MYVCMYVRFNISRNIAHLMLAETREIPSCDSNNFKLMFYSILVLLFPVLSTLIH